MYNAEPTSAIIAMVERAEERGEHFHVYEPDKNTCYNGTCEGMEHVQ